MKMNWKVRFKNKTWLTMFVSLIIGFCFSMLELFDIYPRFTENMAMKIASEVLTFLGLIGVLVDPTTQGIGDSQRAMTYQEPWVDSADKDEDLEEIEE